jgi:hypothetical protein
MAMLKLCNVIAPVFRCALAKVFPLLLVPSLDLNGHLHGENDLTTTIPLVDVHA